MFHRRQSRLRKRMSRLDHQGRFHHQSFLACLRVLTQGVCQSRGDRGDRLNWISFWKKNYVLTNSSKKCLFVHCQYVLVSYLRPKLIHEEQKLGNSQETSCNCIGIRGDIELHYDIFWYLIRVPYLARVLSAGSAHLLLGPHRVACTAPSDGSEVWKYFTVQRTNVFSAV